MAIKKRPVPVPDPALEAKIEAFGSAAEASTEPALTQAPVEPALAKTAPRRTNTVRTVTRPAGEKSEIKPMLVRFDAYEHELLKEVAALEGRSMHNMAKTVLIPALEAIRDAHRQ